MLRRLVVATAVWARWRLLSSNTVKVAGQKWRSDLFSAEQQWCTGFWSSQISSVPVDWSLQSECDVWPSASHACSGHGTPPDPSSVSEPLPWVDQWGPIPEEGWSPAWPSSPLVYCQGCQRVQESTGHGCWRFYWWRKGETRLRCKLSQVDEPVHPVCYGGFTYWGTRCPALVDTYSGFVSFV